jgi:hypothetical protein
VPVAVALDVIVANGGRADLTGTVRVEDDVEGAFFVEDVPLDVPPGAQVTVPVTFTPASYLPYTATLVFATNDVETPIFEVPLAGTGVDLPVPDVHVDPMVLDFGDVAVGTPSVRWFTLANTGGAPLTLGDVAQVGSGAFALTTDPSGDVVAAGAEVPVLLTYTPTVATGDFGTLTLPSDDPDEPAVTVTLLGNGGGDYVGPVAVIDCPGLAEPPETVALDGSASTSPDDRPLSYAWSLAGRPPGSRAELSNLAAPNTRFFADVAGQYDVLLTVTDDVGVSSAPARCTIDAIPADALHVELTWDTPRADVDLHLLDGAAALFSRPGDCTWCNPRPSWGGAGNADDPRLDLDDRGGYGPENVNVEAPSGSSYDVVVHYFDGHGDDVLAATVRVYTFGVLAFERTRLLERNEVWEVARVNWPQGTVGARSIEPYPATVRACQ